MSGGCVRLARACCDGKKGVSRRLLKPRNILHNCVDDVFSITFSEGNLTFWAGFQSYHGQGISEIRPTSGTLHLRQAPESPDRGTNRHLLRMPLSYRPFRTLWCLTIRSSQRKTSRSSSTTRGAAPKGGEQVG